MTTKKVGSAGRFGVRYGRRLRAKVTEVEKKQRQRHRCPYCKRFAVRRISLGVYRCRKCKAEFTGKAYTP